MLISFLFDEVFYFFGQACLSIMQNYASLNMLLIKMIRVSKKITFVFFELIIIFSLFFGLFSSEVLADSDKQNNQLIEKVSKDFTKKFCNGIAFGLSKESAMNFAYKENNLIFQDKKGSQNLNKELIASNIAISVVENCGYPINLKGQEGIKIFEEDYLAMNNSIYK